MRSSIFVYPCAPSGMGNCAPSPQSIFQCLNERDRELDNSVARPSIFSPRAMMAPEVVMTVSTGRRFCPRPLGDHSTLSVWPSAEPHFVTSPFPTPPNTNGSLNPSAGRLTPEKAQSGLLMAGSGRRVPKVVRVRLN